MSRGVVYAIPFEDITLGLSKNIMDLLVSRQYLLGIDEYGHIIYSNNCEDVETFSKEVILQDRVKGKILIGYLLKNILYLKVLENR